jgi:hypothetical protein
MCLGGGSNKAMEAEYQRQLAEEEARQGRVTQGKENIDAAFVGYDDAFYDQTAADYMKFANPQIGDQYEDALRGLRQALARSGQLQSSERIERENDLKSKLAAQEVAAARKGQSIADTMRGNLANVKSNLLTQNASLADPSLIASTAANQIMANTQVPEYNPLTNIFANATEGLATHAQLESRNKNRYEMAQLFAPTNSARII